jgi:hypothetical protein
MIALANRVAIGDLDPAVQFVDRRVPCHPDQPLDHVTLRFLSPADEVRAGAAEVKRRMIR